jgi:hypothetical protein
MVEDVVRLIRFAGNDMRFGWLRQEERLGMGSAIASRR